MKKHTDEISPEEEAAMRESMRRPPERDPAKRREAEEGRREKLLIELSGVSTRFDLEAALEGLAERFRAVRVGPLEGESRKELQQAEHILRALHYMLLEGDADSLKEIAGPAEAFLRKDPVPSGGDDIPPGDGRKAIRERSGLSVGKVEHFGDAVLELVRELPEDIDMPAALTRVMGAGFWRHCPFARLRAVFPGDLIQEPRVVEWFTKDWVERDTLDPSRHVLLGRALLRRLGLRTDDAKRAIPAKRHGGDS